jgi:hypothetical protein
VFQLILPFQLELPFEASDEVRGLPGAARTRRPRVRGQKDRVLTALVQGPHDPRGLGAREARPGSAELTASSPARVEAD